MLWKIIKDVLLYELLTSQQYEYYTSTTLCKVTGKELSIVTK